MRSLLIFVFGVIAIASGSPTVREYCDPSKCALPNCLCTDINPPNGLDASKLPQIVYLTFDDGVTIANYPLYQELFNGNRKNPNGAPISGTFFVTHQYNDYNLTHQLWRQGHEIALHSITHQTNQTYWSTATAAQITADVVDQRKQMSYFANIPEADIVGYRAPFLQLSGNNAYRALKDGGVRYESSRPTYAYRPNLWPYTADYDSLQDCQIAPCPTESFPGFWVSPIVDLIGSNGFPCAFADTCLDPPKNAQETVDLLWKNLQDHRTGSRAPFGIYIHAAWLLNEETPWVQEGYIKFVDQILGTLNDTYIVSISKGLDFVQNPVTLDQLDQLPVSWAAQAVKPNNCGFARSCVYDAATLPPEIGTGERRMTVCVGCPPRYPWVGNNLGASIP